MRAFIIRPFGTRKDSSGNEINFDHVEEKLIAPALKALDYQGRTTLEIAKAGNIRVDMFRRLVTADLVVVDLSIHNANVFYELGIRHALREKSTFLIKCKADATVFDLQTDRYLQYDRDDPAASLGTLIEALRRSQDSDDKDSPVFQMLPELKVQPWSLLVAVPSTFTDDVDRAFADKSFGDLELLSEEATGFEWEIGGLRVVGRKQYGLRAQSGAQITWEAVRRHDPNDLEANTLLGTIYQRLGQHERSNQAINRALARLSAGAEQRAARAELLSLRARNEKALWIQDWQQGPAEERQARALRSAYLETSGRAYADAFDVDLNHFYAGLNALAMMTVLDGLATMLPEVWSERYADEVETERAKAARSRQMSKLAAAVEVSLDAAKRRLELEKQIDEWVKFSEADLSCLTVNRPAAVAHAYRAAIGGASPFAVDAARKQLDLYMELGVRESIVKEALTVFPPALPPSGATPQTLIFTGHRIDAAGRPVPRFPPEKEAIARDAIREAVIHELEQPGGVCGGIAGGASGGDILFHEVCAELGVPTEQYLALPRDRYVPASVAPAGTGWVERFDALYKSRPYHIFLEGGELPIWLRDKPDYSIWQRSNLWMLHHAVATSPDDVTLISLWDGDTGDGPGGTEDMVKKAASRGAKTVILDTKELFGLDAAAPAPSTLAPH
jgi:hypothetical protein